MRLQKLLSLPFAVPITFLLLFVPCIGFLFPNALHSRLLLSLSKHYRIINLPIFAIFSFLTVPLIHFALLTSICSPYFLQIFPSSSIFSLCCSNYLEFSFSRSPYFFLQY